MSVIIRFLKETPGTGFWHEVVYRKLLKESKNRKEDEDRFLYLFDLRAVLRKNNLRLAEDVAFPPSHNSFRVTDVGGERLILKIGTNETQKNLLRTARSMQRELCFRVPRIITSGNDWILLEDVRGEFLYRHRGEWVGIIQSIALDYQKVLVAAGKKEDFGDLLHDGQKHLYAMLNMWSKPIIDAGLMERAVVRHIAEELSAVIARRGERFFTWGHGDIIGDHAILRDGMPYLLDPDVVPCAGRGYHDFLRALSMLLLHAEDVAVMRRRIPKWMKMHTYQYDKEEVRLVFSLLNMGVLRDMLHARRDEAKERLMLQFIKREID